VVLKTGDNPRPRVMAVPTTPLSKPVSPEGIFSTARVLIRPVFAGTGTVIATQVQILTMRKRGMDSLMNGRARRPLVTQRRTCANTTQPTSPAFLAANGANIPQIVKKMGMPVSTYPTCAIVKSKYTKKCRTHEVYIALFAHPNRTEERIMVANCFVLIAALASVFSVVSIFGGLAAKLAMLKAKAANPPAIMLMPSHFKVVYRAPTTAPPTMYAIVDAVVMIVTATTTSSSPQTSNAYVIALTIGEEKPEPNRHNSNNHGLEKKAVRVKKRVSKNIAP